MCGIAGFYQFNTEYSDNEAINAMTSKLVHRGPDDGGVYMNAKVALGHRRLSILDLSALGHQPMHDVSDQYTIVFNGEIYNYLQIKETLLSKGHTFRSRSDTEVILYGFIEWGTQLFRKLNGIFSFAIYDKKANDLYVVRDRLGVKPLYIHGTEKTFYFASEIKAIRAVCPKLNKIDKQAFSSFLYYGNALGTKTLFNDIYALRPGSFILVNDAGIKHERYWAVEDITPIERVNEQDAIKQVTHLLENAVSSQLVSDVPVGIFLSGGIDSSAITAFASRHYSGKIKTFAAAFDFSSAGNELAKAKTVAQHFGTEHHEFFIEGSTLPDIIEKMVYHHDEPFSDAANIPLYLMAQDVKPFATVVLQGDGGDEIFGGYRRYPLLQSLNSSGKRTLYQLANILLKNVSLPNTTYQRLRRMIGALGQEDDAMVMALLLTVDSLKQNSYYALSAPLKNALKNCDPFEHYKVLNKKLGHLDIVQRMLYIDTQTILPNTFLEKVDKSTMAASIEVRVPFLDNDLVEYAMGLPSALKIRSGEKKSILKAALRGVVPNEILDGPKTGFGVPYQNWIRKPLYNVMNDHFRTDHIKQSGLFNYKSLERLIKEHTEGSADHGFTLWKLMNLCIWMNMNKISLNDA